MISALSLHLWPQRQRLFSVANIISSVGPNTNSSVLSAQPSRSLLYRFPSLVSAAQVFL
jgi:hypothetical protein